MTKLKQEKSTETLQEAKIFTKLKIGSIILRIVYSSKETFPPIEKYKILLIKEYLLFLIYSANYSRNVSHYLMNYY